MDVHKLLMGWNKLFLLPHQVYIWTQTEAKPGNLSHLFLPPTPSSTCWCIYVYIWLINKYIHKNTSFFQTPVYWGWTASEKYNITVRLVNISLLNQDIFQDILFSARGKKGKIVLHTPSKYRRQIPVLGAILCNTYWGYKVSQSILGNLQRLHNSSFHISVLLYKDNCLEQFLHILNERTY